jgi:hypothetical protein
MKVDGAKVSVDFINRCAITFAKRLLPHAFAFTSLLKYENY